MISYENLPHMNNWYALFLSYEYDL